MLRRKPNEKIPIFKGVTAKSILYGRSKAAGTPLNIYITVLNLIASQLRTWILASNKKKHESIFIFY